MPIKEAIYPAATEEWSSVEMPWCFWAQTLVVLMIWGLRMMREQFNTKIAKTLRSSWVYALCSSAHN